MVGRVWRALAIPLCMVQLLPAPVGAQSQGELSCGTYRYTYPYNTDNLNEDHYILLDCSGKQLRGWYFGTSDDFDHAREGYLPGFFVVEMTDIAVAGDSVHFTLEVSEEEYFARPVPLRYRSSQEVPEEELEKWTHRVPVNRRQYRGLLNADSLVFAVDGRQRAFFRVGKE